jgi:diguanylate cyclase (GGDEF)-like protein
LLPEATVEQARAFGERIRRLIAETPVPIGTMSLPITVSVGIGETRGESEMTANDLFHVADTNLFKAKAAGRNRVVG